MLELLEMVGKQRLETVFDWSVNSVALDDRVLHRVTLSAHAHVMLLCLLLDFVLMRALRNPAVADHNASNNFLLRKSVSVTVGQDAHGQVWS